VLATFQITANLNRYLRLNEQNRNQDLLILGGHSMGGVVIQEFFYRHPTEVSALILCSTGAKMRVSQSIFDSLRNNFQEYLDFLRVNSFYEKTSKSIIDDSILETSQTNPEVTHSDFEICNKFDTLTKTDSIEVPCLIICGKADKLTPVKYSEYFHEFESRINEILGDLKLKIDDRLRSLFRD